MTRKQRESLLIPTKRAEARVPPDGTIHRLRPPTPAINVAEAARLYVENRLSFTELADRFGYSAPGIRRLLTSHGVTPRQRSGPRDRTTIALRELWRLIHRRCENPKDPSFRHYGARGIRVGRAWSDFEPFRAWALERGFKPGMSVLRIRETGDFTPGNCRVASRAEAVARRFERPLSPAWTTSKSKSTSAGVSARSARTENSSTSTAAAITSSTEIRAFGVTKTVSDWARDRRCRVHRDTLVARLRAGTTPEKAITTKVEPGQRRDGPRPRKPDPQRHRREARIVALVVARGISPYAAARELGVNYSTVVRTLARLGIRHKRPPGITTSPEGIRLHRQWTGARQRCEDPDARGYRYVGGRGVRMCREWSSFRTFYNWAKATKARRGLWLARRDPAADYSPANCFWATRKDALASRRVPTKSRKAVVLITAFGETKGLVVWSRDKRCRVRLQSLIKRLARGVDPEAAIADPPAKDGGKGQGRTIVKAFGEKKPLTAWLRDRRCRVTVAGLMARLKRGVAFEEALTRRPYAERMR